MPKGTNQKLKLYRLAQIMLENTDDEHYITMPEIMEELGKYEVTADRILLGRIYRKRRFHYLKRHRFYQGTAGDQGYAGGRRDQAPAFAHLRRQGK